MRSVSKHLVTAARPSVVARPLGRQGPAAVAALSTSMPVRAAAALDAADPLRWHTLLTEEETMVRQTAHQYAQESLMPRVLEANREERFDREILRELGGLGLLGPFISGYGCAGVSTTAYGMIAHEIEKV